MSPDLKRGGITVFLYEEGYLPETIEKLKIIGDVIEMVSSVFLWKEFDKSVEKYEEFSWIFRIKLEILIGFIGSR